MSYPRNAASPERIAVGPVILIADGTPQSSAVTVTVRGQGGAEAGGSGTIAYGATGVIVYYTPTQAETDFTSFTVIASKASCIPACVTVITSASATPGYAGVDWGKVANPTTALNLSGTNIDVDQIVASVSGAVGSVTGAVGSVTGLTAATVHADLDDIQARLPAALTAGGNIKADALALSGDTVAADNAEAFFDGTGYAGTGNVIPTVTTLTGHTAQTGDSFARIGATGSGLTSLATQASVNTIDDFLDTEIAAILALLDDARGEPAQGAPPVNPDMVTKVDYLYKAWRNRTTQTATQYSLYADDATTVDHKATFSDDATTADRGEVAAGP